MRQRLSFRVLPWAVRSPLWRGSDKTEEVGGYCRSSLARLLTFLASRAYRLWSLLESLSLYETLLKGSIDLRASALPVALGFLKRLSFQKSKQRLKLNP